MKYIYFMGPYYMVLLYCVPLFNAPIIFKLLLVDAVELGECSEVSWVRLTAGSRSYLAFLNLAKAGLACRVPGGGRVVGKWSIFTVADTCLVLFFFWN